MKLHILTGSLALLTLILLCSCQKKSNVPASVEAVQTALSGLADIQVDSVKLDSTWALSDPEMKELVGDEKPSFHAIVDLPDETQAPLLANAVMEWMNEECLDGTFKGSMTDAKGMLHNYLNNLLGGVEREYCDNDFTIDLQIRKVYENKQIITYVCDCYYYGFGAAHGTSTEYGATFRKTDGKLFGWNMFNEEADLQPYLNEGLKKYFHVETDEELNENLQVEDIYSAYYLPKPTVNPWITQDGIVLQYGQYEIACYAAGMPCVTIPLKEAGGLLTSTMRKLVK